jgi:predicted DNA-binding transcriptional regulator AlpA
VTTCPHCGESLELVGVGEVADRLGVSVNTVYSWRAGRRRPSVPFPAPALQASGYAPVWFWAEVEEWAKRAGRVT